MRGDRFEWDDAKAALNVAKHDVSFEVACEAFDDPDWIEEPEPDPHEERWLLLGMARQGILVVIYTERRYFDPDDGEFVRLRIISAREATTHEQARYYRQAPHRR